MVIAIIAIVTVIAVPGFRTMQANSRLLGVTNELASALRQARSESLVQRRNLQFAAISGKTGAQNRNNYGSEGWQILSVNTNPARTYLEQRNIPSTITVSSMNTRSAPATIYFVAATGMLALTGAQPYQPVDVVFSVCDRDVSMGMDVYMSRMGRVSVQRHTTPATCLALK